MDLVTALPATATGHDAIFTVVNRFSKFATFVPCKTKCSAADVARMFFDNIVCKYGMPKKVISDRDP